MNIPKELRKHGMLKEADFLYAILKVHGSKPDPDSIFDFTVSKLKEKYRTFNKKYFDNELPVVPIKKIGSKKLSGVVKSTFTGSGEDMIAKIKYLGISDVFKYTESNIDDTLLHEMIHVYFISRGGRFVKENHGPYFQQKAREINSKGKHSVSLVNDEPPLGVRDNRKLKTGAVLWERNPGRISYTLISLPVFKRKFKELLRYFSRIDLDDSEIVTFYVTDSEATRIKKVFRKLSNLQFYINNDVVDSIIKNGKKIAVFKHGDNPADVKLPSWV